MGYFGGLAAGVGLGFIEPPLALFIAAVPLFKIMTDTAFPRTVRMIGEVFEGAAKPVGSDAEGVIHLHNQHDSDTRVAELGPARRARRSGSRTRR